MWRFNHRKSLYGSSPSSVWSYKTPWCFGKIYVRCGLSFVKYQGSMVITPMADIILQNKWMLVKTDQGGALHPNGFLSHSDPTAFCIWNPVFQLSLNGAVGDLPAPNWHEPSSTDVSVIQHWGFTISEISTSKHPVLLWVILKGGVGAVKHLRWDCYIIGPDQDVPYSLILWYILKIIYLLYE